MKKDGRSLLQEILPLAGQAADRLGRPVALMEVCGTHTTAISRSGIGGLLAEWVELRSGPGCPVCVTDQTDIDRAIALADLPGLIVATFGDMVRVPGTFSSLEKKRALGAEVRIFYSPRDAVELAAEQPAKEVVFVGVGFETTTPIVAMSIEEAERRGLDNYSVLSVHKVVPPVMEVLLEDPELKVDGFILPGHVCTITGRKAFDFIASSYELPAVIAGFEDADILEAIRLLLEQIIAGRAETLNGYSRLVKEEGNRKARQIMERFFEPTDSSWRGFGLIRRGGLTLRNEYRRFDAAARFSISVPHSEMPPGCSCGNILKGKMTPGECPLFDNGCSPAHPVGPCMVSSEGACAARYQYR
jgi:hydrogenase expression/formation protein HypD